MLNLFLFFAKQILVLGGFKVTAIPAKLYRELLTALESLLKEPVVLIPSLVEMCKTLPGKLIVDDTSNPKYGLKAISQKLFDPSNGHYSHGYKVLLFLWETGTYRIPVGFALHHKQSLPLTDLALTGFSALRNQYGLKPEVVLADAAYASGEIAKRLDDYGWAFVMGWQSNRTLSEVNVKQAIPRGYGEASGRLPNGTKVKAVRRKKKFLICNRLLKTSPEIWAWYRKRWCVEEVFRILKSCLGLSGCQQHSTKAQACYLFLLFLLFACLELVSGHSVYRTCQAVTSQEQALENILKQELLVL